MVFLITGPDTYRARQLLKDLRDKFAREVDDSGLNASTVSGSEVTEKNLRHFLQTSPLLARRRLVVFEGLLAEKKPDVFAALPKVVEEAGADGHVVAFYEPVPPATTHPLMRWVTKHGRVTMFAPLTGVPLKAWVTSELAKRTRYMTDKALANLLSITGSDLWRLTHELEKLQAATAEGGTITEELVASLIAPVWSEDVFGLVDALAAGDVKRAAPLLNEALAEGMSAQQLNALLEKSLRTLVLLAAGEKTSDLNPYVTRKLAPVAKRLGREKVERAYHALADLDVALKSNSLDVGAQMLNMIGKASS